LASHFNTDSALHHPYANLVTDPLQTTSGLAEIRGTEGRYPVFIGPALQYHRLRHRSGQLSDQLCHLCGADFVPATFACHTDANGDPYTYIHAHGHLDLHAYLDAGFYGYTDSHCDAQPNAYLDADFYRYTDGHCDAHNNEHADGYRNTNDGPTDGYRYPIALGHLHRRAHGYIYHPHAHGDTTAPHGYALAAPRGLAHTYKRVGQQERRSG
jgi:hypothetical protein